MASEEVDPVDVVKTLMQELEELKGFRDDVDEAIAAECQSEMAELESIAQQIKQLEDQREVVLASMQERVPRAYEDLTQLKSDLSKKESAIKKACHSLPLAVAKKGLKIESGRVRISIAKSTTSVSYSERVLDDHPEFDELYADGDPLVQRKVNPNVMERLVVDGVINEDDVKDYRVEARVRSPQVRITFVAKDD
jgi:hypothetical protein